MRPGPPVRIAELAVLSVLPKQSSGNGDPSAEVLISCRVPLSDIKPHLTRAKQRVKDRRVRGAEAARSLALGIAKGNTLRALRALLGGLAYDVLNAVKRLVYAGLIGRS